VGHPAYRPHDARAGCDICVSVLAVSELAAPAWLRQDPRPCRRSCCPCRAPFSPSLPSPLPPEPRGPMRACGCPMSSFRQGAGGLRLQARRRLARPLQGCRRSGLANGCSASLVSSNGLVATNHHCVRQCLTEISHKGDDTAETASWASSPAEEKRCTATEADRLIEISPVHRPHPQGDRGQAGRGFRRCAQNSRPAAITLQPAPAATRSCAAMS